MNSDELTQKIEKLPVWAQSHIKEIQRQRDIAIRELNKYLDEQTPAAFYIDDLVCTGEKAGPSQKCRYIATRHMSAKHAGVRLGIILRDDCIELSWGDPGWGTCPEVAMIPSSHQQARLVSKDNMR